MVPMPESYTSPVVPVRASTLILVRGEGDKFKVYLLKRSSQSGFMPGNYVFPGGVVDPEDRNVDFWQRHIDQESAPVMTFGGGLNDEDIVSHGIAAIRETFEEAGVLLARQNGGTGRDSFESPGRDYPARIPSNPWCRGPKKGSGARSALDNPRDHHVVVGTDRYRVLVRTTCKCYNILSYLGKGDDFVNITPFGAVYGP